VDRRAVVALVLGALLFTAMMPGTSRGTEQADVSPCDKGCNVKAIFNWDVENGWKTTFDRYYCYPNGKWLCPLTNKEPGLQE
jgi:hypothetical protein